MKKLFNYMIAALILSSCGNSGNGELVGVSKREKFYQPDPFGMARSEERRVG